MLKNYFTIAVRHLTRHKLFSVINILCLAIGITFAIIIGVYVLQQKNVNHDLRNAGNQYFIKSVWKEKDLGLDITSLTPLSKTLKEEYPNLVANYFRYNPVTNTVSAGENHYREDIAICDTTLATIFDFPLLYGDKHKLFTSNNSAVITETMAKKLYAAENPIGKTLSIQTTVAGVEQDFIVSAVLKDIPYNSVTNLLNGPVYNVFVPFTGNQYFQRGGTDMYADWNQTLVLAYVELKPGITAKDLVAPVKQTIRKYTADFVWKNLGAELVPVKDYYLKDNNNAVEKMITALSLVAGFILLMAIINFVNINIGTSAYRLKEIGLRKVFGSARKQLILQFITEAWLLTVIAAIISLVLYQLLLPVFSQVLNTSLPAFWQLGLVQILYLFLLVTLIGFLSGIYPAFVLSAAATANAVKGKTDSLQGGIALRRVLLVIQFSLAITVFICTLNVSRQVKYIFTRDTGYSNEQVLVITALPKQWDSAGVARMESIKQSLLKLSSVKDATVTFDLPESAPAGRFILYPPKETGIDKQLNLPVSSADEDYAKTFGIQVKAGSFFSNNKDGIILNETAVKMLGLSPASAIGKNIKTAAGSVTVTGVVKDYNFSSMQEAIGAIGFVHVDNSTTYRYLVVKLNTANVSQALSEIKTNWKTLSPNAPFDYTFMDEKFAAMYKSELQLQKAADIATALNLIIVLMGIIGVVALTLVKRNKEIAVRKVLGADVLNIILLFIKDYASLIIIANIVAWPLAWMVTGKWLQNYAYRVNQNIAPYLFVSAFVFIAAFLLIALQCFKAAASNPVASLKSE